jgi:hypothetical protein
LELYKLLGVDLMVIPISSVIEKLHRIFKGKLKLYKSVRPCF